MGVTIPMQVGNGGGYTVNETPDAVYLYGLVPISAFNDIAKRALKRGLKDMDLGAAQALGCTMVITSPEGSARIRAEIDQRDAALHPLRRWRAGYDVGISSCAIAWALGGTSLMSGHEPPSDPSDFGRCLRLVRLMGWRHELGRVSKRWPEWAGIVDAWDELEALYDTEEPTGKCPKLYERMQAIRGSR